MIVALMTLVGLSPFRWVILIQSIIQTFAISFVVVLLLVERGVKRKR